MAYYFSAYLSFASPSLAQTCEAFLRRESRPVFEDDVESVLKGLFNVISNIEYPGRTELVEEALFLEWVDEERFSLEDIYPLLKIKGVRLALAYEVPDDPMSYDEDVMDDWFWLWKSGKYRQVNREMALQYVPESIVNKVVGSYL